MFKGKKILVAVTGGIAAYKTCDLVSKLVKEGAHVHVIMTKAATQFVTPLTFESLTHNPVHVDLFHSATDIPHISLLEQAAGLVIAPATANVIAKFAVGIADDLLTTLYLASRCPIILAPAMNVHMYQHTVVQQNLSILRKRGVHIVEAESGALACGAIGPGRLAAIDKIIHQMAKVLQQRQDWEGINVLVTAGGTREKIDPVRYVGNRSSGKMGYALAQAAVERGASVTLVSAPTSLPCPVGVKFVSVETSEEMLEAVLNEFPHTHVVIKAAAVSDYRPVNYAEQKIKKDGNRLVLELEKTTDILATLGRVKEHQVLVGFAAETEDLLSNSSAKLMKKNLDMLVANDVTKEGAGFGADTNIVTLLFPQGKTIELPCMTKEELANKILDEISCLPRFDRSVGK